MCRRERADGGGWCREILLDAAGRPRATPIEEALLSEVLALRTILLNLFYDLADGEVPSRERMQALIDKADGETAAEGARASAAGSSGERGMSGMSVSSRQRGWPRHGFDKRGAAILFGLTTMFAAWFVEVQFT